jgi:plasmid stabilization system protein ParE
MGWKVIFAPRAHARLAEIVRFIANDDPQTAIRFGDYLVDRAGSLGEFPQLGTPYRKRANVRRSLVQIVFHLLSNPSKGAGNRNHGLLAFRAS